MQVGFAWHAEMQGKDAQRPEVVENARRSRLMQALRRKRLANETAAMTVKIRVNRTIYGRRRPQVLKFARF